eukprot:6187569-Pleurochrysis_carterae.AAC.1
MSLTPKRQNQSESRVGPSFSAIFAIWVIGRHAYNQLRVITQIVTCCQLVPIHNSAAYSATGISEASSYNTEFNTDLKQRYVLVSTIFRMALATWLKLRNANITQAPTQPYEKLPSKRPQTTLLCLVM